jgi:hypothetical protein
MFVILQDELGANQPRASAARSKLGQHQKETAAAEGYRRHRF